MCYEVVVNKFKAQSQNLSGGMRKITTYLAHNNWRPLKIQFGELKNKNYRFSKLSKWADNIKGDLRQRRCNCVNWLKLGTEVLRAIRNTIIILHTMMTYILVDIQQS